METIKRLNDKFITAACKTEAGFLAALCLYGTLGGAFSCGVICSIGWLLTH